MSPQGRVLSEAEFNALQERLLREAPPDLGGAQLGDWLRQRLGEELGVNLTPPEAPAEPIPTMGTLDAIMTMLRAAMPGGNMPAAMAATGDANPVVKAGRWAGRHPAVAGAMAAGAAAAPFTAGSSLVPGMVMMGGAGAAGAAGGLGIDKLLGGEATRDMTIPQAAKTVAIEGAYTALGEGVGRGLAHGARLGANKLMDAAIGGQRAIRQKFADVDIADILNRMRINPVTSRGRVRAEQLRDATVGRRNAMARAADAAGVPPIDPLDPEMFNALQPAYERAVVQTRTGRDPEAPFRLGERLQRMVNYNPAGISMEDASKLISDLAQEGRASYLAFSKGTVPHDLDSVTAKGLADGLRRLQRRRVPGIAEANREAQGLIEAAQIADDMSRRPFQMGGHTARGIGIGGAGFALASGGDPLTALLAGVLPWVGGSPTFLAPTSIGLYHGGRALPSAGRLLGALLGESLAEEQTPDPLDEEWR
jgi:hypothetical protein